MKKVLLPVAAILTVFCFAGLSLAAGYRETFEREFMLSPSKKKYLILLP